MVVISVANAKTVHGNERDIEIAAVLNIASLIKKDIKSVLDVGAHWSHATYAPELKKLLGDEIVYDAVDPNSDSETSKIVDNYYECDVIELKTKYDFVFSISALEHTGVIKANKAEDYIAHRRKVLKHIIEMADKYIFMTFPFGQPALIEDQYANFTKEDLRFIMETVSLTGKLKSQEAKFFYRDASFGPYREISEEDASLVPYEGQHGVRCNCFLFIEKL